MAAIINIYFKADMLKTLADTVAKKGEKGVSITLSVNDEVNDYGQNVSAFVSQTKEQKDNQVKRFYVANGKVAWQNGPLVVPPKQEQEQIPQSNNTTEQPEGELPF
jgi:hypothetical protein